MKSERTSVVSLCWAMRQQVPDRLGSTSIRGFDARSADMFGFDGECQAIARYRLDRFHPFSHLFRTRVTAQGAPNLV
jgi:hypothetical protein